MYSLPLIHCKSLLVRPCTNNVRWKVLRNLERTPWVPLERTILCVHMYACSCTYVRTWERARVCTTADSEVRGYLKHNNGIDLWMILYIHSVTSLMNIQIKFYESIWKGNITNWYDIVFLLKLCKPQEELDEKWNKVSRSSYSLPWQRNINDTPI